MSTDSRKRRRWLWLLGGLAAVGLLAAIAIVVFVDVERFEQPIERAIATATGWETDLDGLELSLVRGLVLTASPVEIRAPGQTSRISVDTIEIDAAFWPLLRGELIVRKVALLRPEIVFVREDVDAGWIVPGVPAASEGAVGDVPGSGAPQEARPTPASTDANESDSGPIEVSIDAVEVRGGRMSIEDRTVDPALRVELTDVDVDLSPSLGQLRGRGSIAGGGELSIEGELGRRFAVRLDGLPTEQLHPFLGTELVHGGGALDGELHVTLPLAIEGNVRGTSITLLAGTEPFAEPIDLGFAVSVDEQRWSLDRVTLTSGALEVEGGGPLLPDVALDVRVPETPLDAVLSASRSVLPLPLDLAPPGSVRADARFELPEGGELAYSASGELSAARYTVSESLPSVDDVRASFELGRDGALTVEVLEGTVAGGPVDGTARIDSIDPPGTLTLDGSIENAVLGGLLGPFLATDASDLRGPTGIDADLRLDLSRADDLRALGGTLSLDSREASVPGWDLESAIRREADERLRRLGAAGDLVRALLEGQPDAPAASDPAAVAGEALQEVFESVDAKIDFNRFPWAVERLAVATGGLQANGTGTFDPIEGIVDFALTSTLDAERTADLVRQVDQVKYLVDPDGRLRVPLLVRGPLLRPSIGVDLAAVARNRLGTTPEDAARKAIEDEAKDKVRGLIRGLLDKKSRDDDDRP